MNKRGWVPLGSELSSEVGGVGMKVIGMVTDMPPSSGKGVRYGAFSRGGVVLLRVGGFDVDRGAEMTVVDTDMDIHLKHFPLPCHFSRHLKGKSQDKFMDL